MVDYIAKEGFLPAKIRANNYWYLSPLRQEKTPSFKIDRKLNRWYDFGMGKGGNLLDFAILYNNFTIAEFLHGQASNSSFDQPGFYTASPANANASGIIKITDSKPLHSLALLQYLKRRNITIQIAEKYCLEISFELHSKSYYSIGFRNDSGGFEMRNQWCKNSSSPKGTTTIRNGAKRVAVFEGFFDFLSFLVLIQNDPSGNWDFCILNSLSFFQKAQSLLLQYNAIHLFLDNDAAGQNCSKAALKFDNKYIDESSLYNNYKDLNEWICHMGKLPKSYIPEHPP